MLEIEEFPKIPQPQVKESVILDTAVGRRAPPLCLSGFDGRDSRNSEKYPCDFLVEDLGHRSLFLQIFKILSMAVKAKCIPWYLKRCLAF